MYVIHPGVSQDVGTPGPLPDKKPPTDTPTTPVRFPPGPCDPNFESVFSKTRKHKCDQIHRFCSNPFNYAYSVCIRNITSEATR